LEAFEGLILEANPLRVRVPLILERLIRKIILYLESTFFRVQIQNLKEVYGEIYGSRKKEPVGTDPKPSLFDHWAWPLHCQTPNHWWCGELSIYTNK